jgi:hypothetical protein
VPDPPYAVPMPENPSNRMDAPDGAASEHRPVARLRLLGARYQNEPTFRMHGHVIAYATIVNRRVENSACRTG